MGEETVRGGSTRRPRDNIEEGNSDTGVFFFFNQKTKLFGLNQDKESSSKGQLIFFFSQVGNNFS